MKQADSEPIFRHFNYCVLAMEFSLFLIDSLNIDIPLINTIEINCPYRTHWVYESIPAFR